MMTPKAQAILLHTANFVLILGVSVAWAEPTTIALASLAASVAGTGVAAYSSYRQGQQAQAEGQYNAQVASNQAINARNAAEVAAQNREEQTRRILGAQRTATGASGITTEGSPLLDMMYSVEQGALDAARIRYSGAQTAGAYQAESRLQRYRGGQGARAGSLAAGTTLLAGLGSVGMSYYDIYGKKPVPPYRGGYD